MQLRGTPKQWLAWAGIFAAIYLLALLLARLGILHA